MVCIETIKGHSKCFCYFQIIYFGRGWNTQNSDYTNTRLNKLWRAPRLMTKWQHWPWCFEEGGAVVKGLLEILKPFWSLSDKVKIMRWNFISRQRIDPEIKSFYLCSRTLANIGAAKSLKTYWAKDYKSNKNAIQDNIGKANLKPRSEVFKGRLNSGLLVQPIRNLAHLIKWQMQLM